MISSNVSRKTLNEFEKIINEYKTRVLDDINTHFEINMDKQQFRNMFLQRNITKINRKNTPIDYDKCFAIVYNKEFGYNQCKKSKCKGNYCNLHAKNRFYGSINLNDREENY